MRRLAVSLLFLQLLPAPAFAQAAIVTPQQIGEIFCISRLGNDDAILSGAFSAELRTLIAYAQARNDAIARAFPDEKPPLGDGVPWASFPDAIDTCTLGSIATEGMTAHVVIEYGFAADPGADFSDTLELTAAPHPYDPQSSLWRISDVRYTVGSTLVEALQAAFDD